MSVSNRILKYLKEENPPMAKCIIISDVERARVVVSYNGDKLLWLWKNKGLMCPGSSKPIELHPLAAEALISEEITTLINLEGVSSEEILYLNPDGDKIDGIFFSPQCLERSFDTVLKKEKIKELYWRFIQDGDKLSEELIGEAIASSVLGPFLSVVNL